MPDKLRGLITRHREQISYLFWGGMTTLVSYATYILFSRGPGLDPLAANVLSWICTVAFAFVVNKIFVFRSRSWEPAVVLGESWKFVSARIFSFLVEMAAMFVFVTLMGLNDIAVKVTASVIVIILNYVFSKLVIFKKAR